MQTPRASAGRVGFASLRRRAEELGGGFPIVGGDQGNTVLVELPWDTGG